MKRIRIELTKQDFRAFNKNAPCFCPIENYFRRTSGNSAECGFISMAYQETTYKLSPRLREYLGYDTFTLDYVLDKDYLSIIFGNDKSLVFYATEAK